MRLHARSSTGRRIAGIAVLAVLAGSFGYACRALVAPTWADEDDGGADEGVVAAPSRVQVKDGVVTLTLDTAAQRNGGIVTAPVQPASSPGSVAAYGTVLDAAELTSLGNRYLEAKAQVQSAEANVAVSRAAYERASVLYKDHQSVSQAQMQAAKGTSEVDQASLAAAQSRVASLAASARQSWGAVIGRALLERGPLFNDLVERRAYLVKVTFPPGATIAQDPRAATATLANGTRVSLGFVSPATATNPEIQGTSYFYEVAAADGVLPGLNMAAILPDAARVTGAVVPESAVVWLHGKPWVYLRTGADTFIRRGIQPDHSAPDGGYVVAGLPADARVVVEGAQMLLSEEFRAQVGRGGDQD